MTRSSIALLALVAVAAPSVARAAGSAVAATHSMHAEHAVSLANARRIALRTVRGTIRTSELEREAGGSGLRYTFDIATARGVREVGVDAATGRVLENSSEAPVPATR